MKRFFAIITVICLALSTLVACNRKNTSDDPTKAKEEKYLKAYDLLEQKKYDEAYALFTELGDYKDAAKEAAYFRYLPTHHYIEYLSEDDDETITYTVTLSDKNLPKTVIEEYKTGLKHTCTFTHNEFGLVTRRECSDTEGYTSLYEATYDAKGNLLNETYTDEDGNVSKYDYTYNEKNQCIRSVTTNAPGEYLSLTSTYDAAGREIKMVYELEDGIIVEEFIYGEDGKFLKQTWAEEGCEPYSIYDYYYDEKGRLVEILFTEDGEDGGFRRTTYDDKDQLITEHVFYTFGFEYTNNFEYDEHGNVIKTTYINSDVEVGDDVTISEYTLVYLPFEYTENEWMNLCESTYCWDTTHWK